MNDDGDDTKKEEREEVFVESREKTPAILNDNNKYVRERERIRKNNDSFGECKGEMIRLCILIRILR